MISGKCFITPVAEYKTLSNKDSCSCHDLWGQEGAQ